jgi:predicted anti-sigma-YlaC factor YlaD
LKKGVIRLKCDKKFRELINRSFVEEVSEGERQLIHDHIRDCDGCKRYVELTARTIRGLREFAFTSEPDSTAQVLEILADHTGRMRQHNLQFKNWAAFAAALSMSFVGSALVYQMAKRLAVPMPFDTAQVQAGVLIFWLLPSLCSALCLLAAPGENRGIA